MLKSNAVAITLPLVKRMISSCRFSKKPICLGWCEMKQPWVELLDILKTCRWSKRIQSINLSAAADHDETHCVSSCWLLTEIVLWEDIDIAVKSLQMKIWLSSGWLLVHLRLCSQPVSRHVNTTISMDKDGIEGTLTWRDAYF
jgi:hypothetical protein